MALRMDAVIYTVSVHDQYGMTKLPDVLRKPHRRPRASRSFCATPPASRRPSSESPATSAAATRWATSRRRTSPDTDRFASTCVRRTAASHRPRAIGIHGRRRQRAAMNRVLRYLELRCCRRDGRVWLGRRPCLGAAREQANWASELERLTEQPRVAVAAPQRDLSRRAAPARGSLIGRLEVPRLGVCHHSRRRRRQNPAQRRRARSRHRVTGSTGQRRVRGIATRSSESSAKFVKDRGRHHARGAVRDSRGRDAYREADRRLSIGPNDGCGADARHLLPLQLHRSRSTRFIVRAALAKDRPAASLASAAQ